MVDISEIEGRDAFDDYLSINKELKSYSQILSKLPQIVVLTKTDLISEDELKERTEIFKKKVKKSLKNEEMPIIIPISSITNKGLEELKNTVWNMLEKIPKPKAEEIEEFKIDERDTTSIEITKEVSDIYRVSGGLIEEISRGVILSDMHSFAYFQKRLKQDGILDRLREAGAVDGDTIKIKDAEFIMGD
jgi:GTP-binding protein